MSAACNTYWKDAYNRVSARNIELAAQIGVQVSIIREIIPYLRLAAKQTDGHFEGAETPAATLRRALDAIAMGGAS
jgi:hypothetical protein